MKELSDGVMCVSAAAPAPLFAHMTVPGAGDLVNGALHPFTVPSHTLLLVATGLLIAQALPLRLKEPSICLGIGAALGLGFAFGSVHSFALEWFPGALTCALALCVVAALPLPAMGRSILVGLAAFAIGCDSRPSSNGDATAMAVTLLGTGVALAVGVVNVAIYASMRPNQPWAHVGLRVVASWIAAVAIMLLAFEFR